MVKRIHVSLDLATFSDLQRWATARREPKIASFAAHLIKERVLEAKARGEIPHPPTSESGRAIEFIRAIAGEGELPTNAEIVLLAQELDLSEDALHRIRDCMKENTWDKKKIGKK